MFTKSTSVTDHLLRGAGGAAAVVAAIIIIQIPPAWWTLPGAVALGTVAYLLFRGCPVCWTVGLARTIYAKFAPP